jgi:DNA mismatch repair ATPase MutL
MYDMYDERGNDGNGKNFIQEAWERGSNLAREQGSKLTNAVGNLLNKKQQVIHEEKEESSEINSSAERNNAFKRRFDRMKRENEIQAKEESSESPNSNSSAERNNAFKRLLERRKKYPSSSSTTSSGKKGGVRTKRRRQRQRSRRGGGGSLFGVDGNEDDGNGKTLMGMAFHHGSNAVSAFGNKVSGYWNNNNKLPQSPSRIAETHEPFSGNGHNWVWDDMNRQYEEKATGYSLKNGLIYDSNGIDEDGNDENGRSATRWAPTATTKQTSYKRSGTRVRSFGGGKRTRRKTKRRRY